MSLTSFTKLLDQAQALLIYRSQVNLHSNNLVWISIPEEGQDYLVLPGSSPG